MNKIHIFFFSTIAVYRKISLLILFFILLSNISKINAQDTTKWAALYTEHPWLEKISFTGDVRLRLEADWDSRKPDGSFRENRARMRYRLRFGFDYQWNKHIKFGARLRNGNPFDQQGPHTTFGGGTGEFRLGDFNIEKIFLEGKHDKFWWWGGKNTFPFWKQNELFWNDNVMPDGAALGLKLPLKKGFYFNPTVAHFIITHSGRGFLDDGFLQGMQLNILKVSNKTELTLNSAFFYFKNIGNLPDGYATYTLDYELLIHSVEIALRNTSLKVGLDFMQNLANYANHNELKESVFKDERQGFVANIKYGSLDKKGNWYVAYYFANLGKYAIVDYFAQNDWARWDYSGIGASGSRLSNFEGHEIRIAYAFGKNFRAVSRTYFVKELKAIDSEQLETGSRFRIDFDIKF